MNLSSNIWRWKYAIVALVFFLVALFIKNETLDVAIGNTYWVIAKWQICVGFGILFLLFSFIIFSMHFFNKPLSTWIVAAHWLMTIVSIRTIFALLNPNVADRDYDNISVFSEMHNSGGFFDINFWVAFFVVVFALVQVIFFTNVLVALFKRQLRN